MLQAAGSIRKTMTSGSGSEDQVIVQAVRLNTLSKLTFSDSKRFDSLLQDVFVGVPFEAVPQPELEGALMEACIESHLTVNNTQVSPPDRK